MKFRGTHSIAVAAIGGSLALAIGAGSPAVAQDAPWEFSATSYLWMSGIKTKVSPPGTVGSHSVSQSFTDILKILDGPPIMLAGEVRNGRFGFVGDLIYLPVASRIDTRNLLFNDGKAKLSTLTVSGIGFYRVADDAAIKADVGAGFRLWSVSSKTTLNAGILPAESAKLDKTFIDPVLAARATLSLSDRWSVTGYFDIGGFDLGKTKVTWQLLGTVNYRAASWVDLRAGWRHIALDRGNLAVDIDGPILGATIRF